MEISDPGSEINIPDPQQWFLYVVKAKGCLVLFTSVVVPDWVQIQLLPWVKIRIFSNSKGLIA
jgi:hypothetical protein